MPIVRSTRPDLDEQLPIALAARIADVDRSSLSHLVDHGLVPRLDIDAVRSLATSGEVAAKGIDDPGHLVVRLDADPAPRRVVDMSDTELSAVVEGPHRVPASYRHREVLITVRSFVIATGRIDTIGDPVALRTDRRGREVAARPITVTIERRLNDLTTRPPKAAGESRWLGRRARVGTGGVVLPLTP
ncbi:hypothetical protein ACTXL6_00395 [Brachybacterium tyrofermentans]|uniref:hypothetical protein n=1 Tax=Brachybacterium tyrofermentans TaxID=47848 RepID=UPI003FD19042